jgi:hypothetical protein
MVSLRRFGPLPPFPRSLVKGPLGWLLVYSIGPALCVDRESDVALSFGPAPFMRTGRHSKKMATPLEFEPRKRLRLTRSSS